MPPSLDAFSSPTTTSASRYLGMDEKNHLTDDDDDQQRNDQQCGCSEPQRQQQLSTTTTPAANRATSFRLDQRNGKLYGREKEEYVLRKAYDMACREVSGPQSDQHDGKGNSNNSGSSSVVLITGPSGTGKTSLARSLESVVRQDGGFFLYGKCDQIQTQVVTVPYAPFAEAFGQLVDQVLMSQSSNEGRPTTTGARGRLQHAIIHATEDTSLNTLTDVIPAFKKLMVSSKQPSFSRLTKQGSEGFCLAATSGGADSGGGHNDIPIHTVFCKFLQAFCSPEAPFILLLDDLQWLDASSLSLFKAVAMEQANIPGFFLVCTCRGNEVSYKDPLAEVLRTLEDKHQVAIQDIAMQNLSLPVLQDLVQDLFQSMPKHEAEQVAELVFHQTQGNVFFALQLLRNLVETTVLRQDDGMQQQWRLQLTVDTNQTTTGATSDGTAAKNILLSSPLSSNLDCVALCSTTIANLIQQQKHETADFGRVLMVASCLGTEFTINQIEAGAHLDSRESLERSLHLLLDKGILSRRHETTSTVILRSTKAAGLVSFRWTHDRFQQVAYSLIPKDKRADFHISVGLNLLRRTSPLELQNHPFVAVHQFCRHPKPSRIQFKSENERTQLVALCLAAGERSALSSAFETAGIYLRIGLGVIGSPATAFANHYELSLNLFNAAAEMECCRGNFEAVDSLVAKILEHTTTFENQLRAYETHIYSLGSRQDPDGTIRLGLKVLRMLGQVFPRKVSMLSMITHVFRTKRRLARVGVEDVLKLKPLRDWKKSAIQRIMNLLVPACHRCNVNLSVLLAIRAIELTFSSGLHEISGVGFASFGVLLCNPLGYVDEGIRIAKIGAAIQEMFDTKSLKCRTEIALWGFTMCWKVRLQNCIDPLLDGAKAGFLSGDIEMACLALYCANCASLFTGAPLLEMEQDLARLNEQFSRRHQAQLLFYLRASQQVVQNLRDLSTNNKHLSGDFFNEKIGLQQAKEAGDVSGVAVIYMCQCLLGVYFNDPYLCKRVSKALKKSSLQSLNAALLYQAHFVGGLAEVVGARSTGKKRGRAGLHGLKSLRKFAEHAPENVLNKIYLIEAERLTMRGSREKALAKYQLSIDTAKEQNLLHEEALAWERAGLALVHWGESTTAISFLEKARILYEAWGSTAKVDQLSCMLSKPIQPFVVK